MIFPIDLNIVKSRSQKYKALRVLQGLINKNLISLLKKLKIHKFKQKLIKRKKIPFQVMGLKWSLAH